jgi:uncharacterized protein YbjT (DUF2867 family)
VSEKKKIVIIGGTGLIGSKAAVLLRGAGHEVLAASPGTGVDATTGTGVAAALQGADVVIDVSNKLSADIEETIAFFRNSGRNLLRAASDAGVGHYLILSIVGVDRMPGNRYFDAKLIQEEIVTASGVPYTIVRCTQFLEFLKVIADTSTVDGTVRLSGGSFQPIAAADASTLLAEFAVAAPVNGVTEIAGPVREPFDDLIRRFLGAIGDPRKVLRDPAARYFGGEVSELSLVPTGAARLGRTDLGTWLAASHATA